MSDLVLHLIEQLMAEKEKNFKLKQQCKQNKEPEKVQNKKVKTN